MWSTVVYRSHYLLGGYCTLPLLLTEYEDHRLLLVQTGLVDAGTDVCEKFSFLGSMFRPYFSNHVF